MKNYNKILELLHNKFGWKLTDSLTSQGKKLVLDTLKANDIILNDENPIEKTKQDIRVSRLLWLVIGFALATLIFNH